MPLGVTEYIQNYQLWRLRQEDCYESEVRLGRGRGTQMENFIFIICQGLKK